MEGDVRRQELLRLISESEQPVSGTALAQRLCVSRQVIVQDIALLRAGRHPVLATSRGYMLLRDSGGLVTRTVQVKHDGSRMEEELNAIVDCGACVLDVTVEHQIYGVIRAELKVASRREVQLFLQDMARRRTKPLTALTGGVHCHTIGAGSEEVLDLAVRTLQEKGFLYP